MSVVRALDSALSYIESLKKNKQESVTRQSPQAQKVKQRTQRIIDEKALEQRREIIRLARQAAQKSNGFEKGQSYKKGFNQ